MTSLAATKFIPPRCPAGFLLRPRLSRALDQGASGTFTVIAAAAGAGKSATLSAWAEGSGRPVAWLSLDAADADPHRFWQGVIEALRRSGAEQVVAALAVHPQEPADIMLPDFVNALEAAGEPVVLVLDDLHHAASPGVHSALAQLARRAVPNLRLIVATRQDPPIGLERLRLEGRLTELRSHDLAFTLEETADLYRELDVKLPEQELRALWTRTEGWAAGLRLAATTLSGHSDPARFVAEFAGDDASVADYLVAEVLAGESEESRDFLLRASVAETLTRGLAATLTGAPDTAQRLEDLHHHHALIEPVDDRREAFRLHPLFAELLRARLHFEYPKEVAGLHRRAAAWHVEHGDGLAALGHAVAAEDWTLAARIAGDRWVETMTGGEPAPLRVLLEALPPDQIAADPGLALAYAGTLFDTGPGEQADRYLERAEERAAALSGDDARRFELMHATVVLFRGRVTGDADGARDAAAKLLADGLDTHGLAGEDALHALAHVNVGIAELWAGESESARIHLERGLAAARRASSDWLAVFAIAYLAVHDYLAGRPAPAERRAREALEAAAARGWLNRRPTAAALAVRGAVLYDWNRLDEAERALDSAAAVLGDSRGRPLRALLATARARVLAATGRLDEALESVREGLDELSMWPPVPPLAGVLQAEGALLRAALGDSARAREELASDASQSPETAVALARLDLAAGDPKAAHEHVAAAFDEPGAMAASTRVTAWAVDSLAWDATADHEQAARSLELALDAAEAGGFRRPFVSQGEPLLPVLRRQLRLGTAHRALVDDLLTALNSNGRAATVPVLLPEQLSEREIAVLRYLPTMMSNQEIASELFVSVNTVKTHLRAIYRKLGVADRREAVRKAREMSLLAP